MFRPVCPVRPICQQPRFLGAVLLSSRVPCFSAGSTGLWASLQPTPRCLSAVHRLCSCFSLPSNRGKGNLAKMPSLMEFFLLVFLFTWPGSYDHIHSSSVLISVSIDFTGFWYSMLTAKLFFARQTHTKPLLSGFVYRWVSFIINITQNCIDVFSMAHIIHSWVNCLS